MIQKNQQYKITKKDIVGIAAKNRQKKGMMLA